MKEQPPKLLKFGRAMKKIALLNLVLFGAVAGITVYKVLNDE